MDDGLGRRLVRGGGGQLRRPARASQELQRVDEQGLPRTRLAGQYVQPRAGLDRELLDDGQVADLEVRDHPSGKSTSLPPPSAPPRWCSSMSSLMAGASEAAFGSEFAHLIGTKWTISIGMVLLATA